MLPYNSLFWGSGTNWIWPRNISNHFKHMSIPRTYEKIRLWISRCEANEKWKRIRQNADFNNLLFEGELLLFIEICTICLLLGCVLSLFLWVSEVAIFGGQMLAHVGVERVTWVRDAWTGIANHWMVWLHRICPQHDTGPRKIIFLVTGFAVLGLLYPLWTWLGAFWGVTWWDGTDGEHGRHARDGGDMDAD